MAQTPSEASHGNPWPTPDSQLPTSQRTMITLDTGAQRFNYRIVGVAVVGGRVLLHRAERDAFWSLPGGRAELGEPAEQTLRRELREELGVEIRVERLLWVVENFFSYDDHDYHELALYFLMTLPPDDPRCRADAPFVDAEEGVPLIFRWFPLADLDRTVLYPTFLKRALRDLPLVPTHVVHTDTADDAPSPSAGG